MCLGRSKPRVTPFFLLSLLPFFFAPVHCRLPAAPKGSNSLLSFSSSYPSPPPCLPASRFLPPPPFPSSIYLPSWAPFSSDLSLQRSSHQRRLHGRSRAASRLFQRRPQRGALTAPPRSCWPALANGGNDFFFFFATALIQSRQGLLLVTSEKQKRVERRPV